MNRSTKGAIAAAAAAVLLLGGAGSLAYWTADGNIAGGDIDSGTLTLSAPSCGAWELDGGDTFTPGVTQIVPGDTITRVCDSSLVAEGDHIGATLTMDSAAFTASNGLTDELTANATFTVDGAPYAPITSAGTYDVEATITVDFPYGVEDNGSKSLTATLDAITISAVQTHNA